MPLETAKTFHSIYQTALGTDQSEFSSTVAFSTADTESPPHLAVSEHYMNFVRSGLITVSRGKLAALSGREATVSPSTETLTDIAAVVLATGFEAASSLSFLPAPIQQTLSLDATDLNNTVALAFHGTHHPDIPHLGFVGFYRSPYWGVAEMQARLLTAMWTSSSASSLPPALKQALDSDDSIPRTLALRTDPRATQFPMGDYPWLMQEFAAALSLPRVPHLSAAAMPKLPPAGKAMDILTPARYPSLSASEFQRAETVKSLQQTETAAREGVAGARFVARAVFRSLLGEWKLERDLVSVLPSHPSGHFSGTARFLLRDGTRDGREGVFDAAAGEERGSGADWAGMEYLYIEEGDFTAANGLSFRATRRYVWRYDEGRDTLSVWFVRTDDPLRADYLFHEVEFRVPSQEEAESGGGDSGEGKKGWEATAGHLCVEDFYDVQYEFNFKAVNLRDWRLAYTVKGPKKDYTIDGVYTR